MHLMRLFVRPAVLVAFLAVVAFLFVSPSRDASAGGFNFTGVVCIEVVQGAIPRATLGLARIEPSATQGGAFDVTLQAYEGDTNGDTIADTNAGPPCNPADDTNSLTAGVGFDQIDITNRPSAIAKLVTKGTDTSLDFEGDCTFRADINLWVLARFNIVVTGQTTLTKNSGSLDVWLNPVACPGPPLPPPTLSLTLSSHVRTSASAKGAPVAALADDWDADGRTDWNELATRDLLVTFPSMRCDPFNPQDNDCGKVGGIAELPGVAGTPLETTDSSGISVGLIAALAAGAAAGAMTLGGAAWYARRRWLR